MENKLGRQDEEIKGMEERYIVNDDMEVDDTSRSPPDFVQGDSATRVRRSGYKSEIGMERTRSIPEKITQENTGSHQGNCNEGKEKKRACKITEPLLRSGIEAQGQ